jgi:hypothetical protein
LTDLTVKLKQESRKDTELHKQQVIKQDQKWKIHMDSKTTAFATHMEQEKIQFEATTNQTIKAFEAMNNRLRFENKTIKACCDSQAIQKAMMQQQITQLLAQQSISPSNYAQDHQMDYDHKHNALATPTTMSNSPTKSAKNQ